MSSLTSAVATAPAARTPMGLPHAHDELLAQRAARGSERAFTTLYERYHQQLYRYCRSILRNDQDAQDALQSTFASALAALKRDQRSAPLRPWLYRIAHNEAISLLRRRSRDAGGQLDAESLGLGPSVEQQAADRARWRSLMADLGALPDRQRGALLLRELSGLSHQEIAIALGTSVAGAKQAVFEARQALAELEEGRAMSCEEIRRQISEGDRRVLRGRRVDAHLRECAACEAFALAIPIRRAQLRAMTPALPPAVAGALLARSLHAPAQGAGTATAGGGAGTGTGAGAAAAGKAAGGALMWKTIAGVAVMATTAAGLTGVGHLLTPHHAAARRPPAHVARVLDTTNVRSRGDASRAGARGPSVTRRRTPGADRRSPQRVGTRPAAGPVGGVGSAPVHSQQPAPAPTLASRGGNDSSRGHGSDGPGSAPSRPVSAVRSTTTAVRTAASATAAAHTATAVLHTATAVLHTATAVLHTATAVLHTATTVVRTAAAPVLRAVTSTLQAIASTGAARPPQTATTPGTVTSPRTPTTPVTSPTTTPATSPIRSLTNLTTKL